MRLCMVSKTEAARAPVTPAPVARAIAYLHSEGPTLALLVGCHALWAGATLGAATLGLWTAIPLAALMITLHSSLQHEVLHGHPFRARIASEATVFLPLGLIFPYRRFRDLHLAHHRDANLTDPYDDPESNYLDPRRWARLSAPMRALLRANNALLGRMLLGPAIGAAAFLRDEARLARTGAADARRALASAWALHGAGLALVGLWLTQIATMPLWAYAAAAYGGLSLLKIRTFLEHQAHDRVSGRTAIVEDRGLLALLFLNNNLHAPHHAHPQVPWHRLPALYAARRAEFLRRNGGYVYRSYAVVLRRHLLRAKDPVPHPLMRAAQPPAAP